MKTKHFSRIRYAYISSYDKVGFYREVLRFKGSVQRFIEKTKTKTKAKNNKSESESERYVIEHHMLAWECYLNKQLFIIICNKTVI